MSNRNFTITICATGETADAQTDLDAFVAGLRLRGMWMASANLSPDIDGPVAVNQPEIIDVGGNMVNVVIPNYDSLEGAVYRLESSDDNWNTFTPISDNAGPNEVFPLDQVHYRKYRVTAYLNGVPTYGVSSSPSP